MKGQEIKAEERDAIFGESPLGYVIFGETSLKTNGSHWKPYLWRNHPLKAVFLHSIIRKSKFPQNPKRSVRFSGKRTKRSVQKRKARNTQKAETKVL